MADKKQFAYRTLKHHNAAGWVITDALGRNIFQWRWARGDGGNITGLHLRMLENEELSLVDDDRNSGDPYNHTGTRCLNP